MPEFDVFQVEMVFQVEDTTDMLFHAFMQALNPRHPCNHVLEVDTVLLQSSVVFVSSDCVAAIRGERVPVPIRPPPKYYPDAEPHASASSTCFCTGSGLYVHQLRRYRRPASARGMSLPSRHFPGNPMRGPQQHEIIIGH